MLAIRLPTELEGRLNALAKETHRAKSFYVREALANYIDDLEDIYTALDRLEAPSARRWRLDELKRGDDVDG